MQPVYTASMMDNITVMPFLILPALVLLHRHADDEIIAV